MVHSSVIQGYFPGGQLRIAAAPAPIPRPPAPPARAVISAPAAAQPHAPHGLRVPPPRVPLPRVVTASPSVQTRVVQRVGHGTATQLPAHLAPPANAGGQPLPAQVRQKMESFFGTTFGDVRVHVGPHAATIGALAFTQGSNIHFAPGQFNPASPHGQHILAHELAHVVQQRTGRVRNPFGSGVAIVQDAVLEAEADRLGQRAASMPATPVQPKVAGASHAAPAGATVQMHQHADDMRKRRRFKRSLKTAINRILNLGAAGPATVAQINIHDEVQHAGAHHGFRNVTVAKLVGDIRATIAALTQLNLAQSDNP